MQWQVHIRMLGESDWYSIWGASGAFAERDARARFEHVQANLVSRGSNEANAHASRWSAVRLTHEGEVVDEFPRSGVTAKHPLP